MNRKANPGEVLGCAHATAAHLHLKYARTEAALVIVDRAQNRHAACAPGEPRLHAAGQLIARVRARSGPASVHDARLAIEVPRHGLIGRGLGAVGARLGLAGAAIDFHDVAMLFAKIVVGSIWI
jgi:hypothetical protein